MPAMTAYVNPWGNRRHAFSDCPHLRSGYETIIIDSRYMDCKTCKRRLQKAQMQNEAATKEASR